MASAVNSQPGFSTVPYRRNYNNATHQVITHQQARYQMQQEKLSLQALMSDYFALLLAEFERSVDNSKQRVQRLTTLLEQCQQTDAIPELDDLTLLHFWCRFHTVIAQYCQVRQHLMDFPASIRQWQLSRPLSCSG